MHKKAQNVVDFKINEFLLKKPKMKVTQANYPKTAFAVGCSGGESRCFCDFSRSDFLWGIDFREVLRSEVRVGVAVAAHRFFTKLN